MFPYGAAAGDTRVTSKASLTDEYVSDIIVVPHGLPVRDGQLLNGVYVSKNPHISTYIHTKLEDIYKQESIPIGCTLPARPPYMF